jgi:hypothetical protein
MQLYEVFILSLYTLWKIVAIGNTEQSNKMVSYTTDQKMFVVKTFYSSGGSHVAVETWYHQESSVNVALSRETDKQIVKQFEEAGSVCDKRVKGCNCSMSYGGSCLCSTGGNNRRCKKKYSTFSTTDFCLNQHCMENLS